eukprot:1120511-Prymnesium_polylepis.1
MCRRAAAMRCRVTPTLKTRRADAPLPLRRRARMALPAVLPCAWQWAAGRSRREAARRPRRAARPCGVASGGAGCGERSAAGTRGAGRREAPPPATPLDPPPARSTLAVGSQPQLSPSPLAQPLALTLQPTPQPNPQPQHSPARPLGSSRLPRGAQVAKWAKDDGARLGGIVALAQSEAQLAKCVPLRPTRTQPAPGMPCSSILRR